MAICLHPIKVDGVFLPCGKCPVCRQNLRQSLADRYHLYFSLCKSSFFITLTYVDEHLNWCLPDNMPLSEAKSYDWRMCFSKNDVKNFIRRFRYRIPSDVEFLVSSEYGDQFGRPHYHLCLFIESHSADIDYIESLVSELWHFGNVEVSFLSPDRIAYCVKYALKEDYKHPWYGYTECKPFRLFPRNICSKLAPWLNDYFYNDGSFRSSISVGGHRMKLDRTLKNNLDPSIQADLKFHNFESNFEDIQMQYYRSKNLHSKVDCFGSVFNDTDFDLRILEKRSILAQNKKHGL